MIDAVAHVGVRHLETPITPEKLWRAVEAAGAAMGNPLLEGVALEQVRALLINITGGDDLTLHEVEQVIGHIGEQIDPSAQLIFGSKLGPWFHMAVVVDEETDIYDKDKVIHAMCTKCHPVDGIHVYENSAGTPLNPFASIEERMVGKGSKVVFDCLTPLDWKKADIPIMVSFDKVYPEEVKQKVLDNWKSYGFKD